MDKKEETDNNDSWKSPIDDDNNPDHDYNNHVEKQKLDDIFDDAIINSGKVKKVEKKETDKRKPFREQWDEVDELCPVCGNVSKKAEGLNRQNIKRLMSFQTDVQSLTILFLFIMCCLFAFVSYSYMVNPVNCSNFTILDEDVAKAYDYGDHTIVYDEDDLPNLLEDVYIHPESIPTTMDDTNSSETYSIEIENITE